MYVKRIGNVMPRRTHDDSLKTKKNILASAQRLFTRRGFERTSLSDIAKYAGVTRGAIYWHFENKEHFSLNLLNEASDVNESDPLGKFKTWLGGIVEDQNIKFMNSPFMSMMIAIVNGSSGNKSLRDKFLEKNAHRHECFAMVLKNAIAKKQLPTNLDISAAVEHLGVFFVGYMHQARMNLADEVKKNFAFYVDLEMETISHITKDALNKKSLMQHL